MADRYITAWTGILEILSPESTGSLHHRNFLMRGAYKRFQMAMYRSVLIVGRTKRVAVFCILRYFSQISAEGIATMLFVVSHCRLGFVPYDET